MKRKNIEWVEKIEGGIKRKIRVTFLGNGNIKWQFKRSDQEDWDYESAPDANDWMFLEKKTDALYQRRRVPYKDLELVKKLREAAGR